MRRLTLIVFAFSIVVLWSAGAHASASWRSALTWSSASVDTECPDDICSDSNWHIGSSTSVTCSSSGTCPWDAACTAFAFALGRNNWTGAHRVSAAGCGSAGLSPMASPADTLAVSLIRVNPTTLRVTLTGVIGPGTSGVIGPGTSGGITPVDTFRVVVWDFGTFSNPEDTFDPIPGGSILWSGSARLTDAGLATSGSLSPGDFTASGADYTISKSFDFSYSGSDAVVAVASDIGHAEVTAVPTLSEWALIVLTLVLMATGAYVYRRVGSPRSA